MCGEGREVYGGGGDLKGQVMEKGCQTTLSVSIVSSPPSPDKDILVFCFSFFVVVFLKSSLLVSLNCLRSVTSS